MRKALLDRLTECMRRDASLHLLTADTGFHVFDDFQREFADRYLNAGIAEAGMIGIAAGLALNGKRVMVYGIVPFVTMRCFEQIRCDLCSQRLPVTIVGVGEGLTYGPAGPSHHAVEDIAVMRALPGMTVVCPGDPIEVTHAVESIMQLEGPCYLRIGKSGEPVVHEEGLPAGEAFALGRGIRLREGRGIAVIATGNMLPTACQVSALLERAGHDPGLISMHTVKPIDRELIIDTAARCDTLVTIEEHSVIGGLGAAVAGVVTDKGLGVRVIKCGIPDVFAQEAGSQAYLRRQYGLTAEQIMEKVIAE
jgi:transketolase